MNIVPLYLFIYFKKDKQVLRVWDKLAILRWIKKYPNRKHLAFRLEQTQFSMSDTYEVE